jgi:hypothetical protein
MAKVKRVVIPNRRFEVPSRSTKATDEEVEILSDLIRQGKKKEFDDYINNRMIGNEIDQPSWTGYETRDFLSSALSKAIQKKYPNLRPDKDGKYSKEQFEFLRDNVYPLLSKAQSSFGRGNEVILAKNNDNKYEDTGTINLDSSNKNFISSALHELGHAADHIAYDTRSESSLPKDKQDLLSKMREIKPAYAKILNRRRYPTTNSEYPSKVKTISENDRMPNFEDYNWQKGDFDSDYMPNPLDIQKNTGSDHHQHRDYPYDNFINFIEGDLKNIVKSEDRFKNIIKKLA